MRDSIRKYRAFSAAEAIITLIIIGVIAVCAVPQLLMNDMSKDAAITRAKKMNGYLAQASLEILLYHSGLDDFTTLKDSEGKFSVNDGDAKEITRRMSNLFLKYLLDVQSISKSNKYFNAQVRDYNGESLGSSLKDMYSNFFFVNDGMLIGFRFYGNCSETEMNFVSPERRERISVENSCGSIFYDVNSYDRPNRLGYDQFIIPVGLRGIKYEND